MIQNYRFIEKKNNMVKHLAQDRYYVPSGISYFLVLWVILKQLRKQINQPMHSEYVMRFSDPDRRTLA